MLETVDLTTLLLGAMLFFISIGLLMLLNLQFAMRKQFHRLKEQIDSLSKENQFTEQGTRDYLQFSLTKLQQMLFEKLGTARLEQNTQGAELKEQMHLAFNDYRSRFDERQMETLKILQDTLQKGTNDSRLQVKEALNDYAKDLGLRVDKLTDTTELKLKEINQQVERRLSEGFEKTNETFTNVIKRLALIDEAQKKITELSSNVMSLQEILNDKKSRGTFGEVQLSALIRNMIPERYFSLQHTLSNGKRPDCILFLPEPTGHIAIDAKFPLESYRLLLNNYLDDIQKNQILKQFKLDIRKHIQDIAEKYIIEGETSDGAVMFIPAEAVFAEIHAHHDDLVEYAQRLNVWLVSPTTMMAILTTARAVLKDAATRKQVHEIQKHLRFLAEDFDRFQVRMDNLAKRIAQTYSDVEQVHISSRKISQRFGQIEKVELANIASESTEADNIAPITDTLEEASQI